MPISFEQPWWLLLLVAIVPYCWLFARKSEAVLGSFKSRLALAFRILVGIALTMSLARPLIVKRGEAVSVVVVADESASIPLAGRVQLHKSLGQAASRRERPVDRVGLITVAEEAEIAALPQEQTAINTIDHPGGKAASNLEAGVRLALATLPKDTANRILLISDGNETKGTLMGAADEARAAGVPIDVVPIRYVHDNDVVFEELRAPARVRLGQNVDIRMEIRAQNETPGSLRLWVDDQPVDLDPNAPGDAKAIVLKGGPNALSVPAVFDRGGAHRIRAVFEPDTPDGIEENNVGEAVVFVQGEGRVLIVDDSDGVESEPLIQLLRKGHIDAERTDSTSLAANGGATYLSGYDSVIFANVARWSIDNDTDRAIHSYVHDLGGGFVMLGGDKSFGAGGWIDSETAKTLPVKLDPPQTRQIMRGALALVMHSCEMPQGNYWGKTVAISAIEALSRLDYVGIVLFNWSGIGSNGADWAWKMQMVGDKSGPIGAAKAMQVGDMPDFGPSLQLAYDGLMSVKGGQKHAIVISDGDPAAPPQKLLDDYVKNKITITTVLVVGHGGDQQKMEGIAKATGGRFHFVRNPKELPKIFIKEASVVSRSLIQEGNFVPNVQPMASGPTKGVTSAPPVSGYVLTVAREGLGQIPMGIPTQDARDPLLAYWNYGLGRTLAFTSDLTGRWGPAWASWSNFQSFWEQAIRWTMRPAQPRDVTLRTTLDGSKASVEVETLEGSGAAPGSGSVQGTVVGPDGNALSLPLRQVAAGRWRGDFNATDKGAYLVNVGFATEGAEGEVRTGSIQAGVSVPYAKEFRAVRDNESLLKAVADRTGGRVISPAELDNANLFDRRGIDVPASVKRIWDIIAMIAAALFVLDVASRRIAFDSKEAREAAARALGRVQKAGEGSVDAWRKARTRAETRVDRSRESAPPQAAEPPPVVGAPVRPEGADDDRPAAGPAPPKRAAPAAPAPGDAGGLSRLRQAKKRATGGGPDATEGEDGGAPPPAGANPPGGGS